MTSLLRREPSAALLAGQLLSLLLYPLLEGSTVGRALFNVLGIALLGLVVLAVRRSPGLTWVAALLGGSATVLLVVQAIDGDIRLQPWSSGIEALLYFYAAGALIVYMLADHRVTRDELFAVGAAFTLVAWAFAHLYVVCQAVAPDSFIAAVHPARDRSWIELLFLSFTTLSSTGLSDVIPIRPYARVIVMFEQLAGVAYLAMLVTRLVGLTTRRRSNGGQTAED
jgi:Ion channel